MNRANSRYFQTTAIARGGNERRKDDYRSAAHPCIAMPARFHPDRTGRRVRRSLRSASACCCRFSAARCTRRRNRPNTPRRRCGRRSLLDTQGIGEPLQEGSSSGRFDDQYSWQLNISKYDPPPVTTTVTPIGSSDAERTDHVAGYAARSVPARTGRELGQSLPDASRPLRHGARDESAAAGRQYASAADSTARAAMMRHAPCSIRQTRGFTLLEVLMAIVLLALLLAGAYGGIKTSVRAMHAGEAGDRACRSRAHGAGIPAPSAEPDPAAAVTRRPTTRSYVFEGERGFMRFVAPMPGYLSHGGPYVQTLELTRGRRAACNWCSAARCSTASTATRQRRPRARLRSC